MAEIKEKIPNTEQNTLKKYCKDQDRWNLFSGLELSYDHTTIIMYDSKNPEVRHCYELNELVKMMKHDVGNINRIERNNRIYIKIPFWEIYVDERKLKYHLSYGCNTFSMISVNRDNFQYYIPEVDARRDELKIVGDFNEDVSYDLFTIPKIEIKNFNGIEYKIKTDYYVDINIFDFDKNEAKRTDSIYRIETFKKNKNKFVLNDFKETPAIRIYYPNNVLKEHTYCENSEIHREDDIPAIEKFYENGSIESREWYQNGKPFRENDRPTDVIYLENIDDINPAILNDRDELPMYEKWHNRFNKLDRENNLPAFIQYDYEEALPNNDRNGIIYDVVITKVWLRNDERFRSDDGPTDVIYTFINGVEKKYEESWISSDIYEPLEYFRRDDKPSRIVYDEKERQITAEWISGNKNNLVRPNGKPVRVRFEYGDEEKKEAKEDDEDEEDNDEEDEEDEEANDEAFQDFLHNVIEPDINEHNQNFMQQNAGNAEVIYVADIGVANVGPVEDVVGYIIGHDIILENINNLNAGQLNAIREEIGGNNFDEERITLLVRKSARLLVDEVLNADNDDYFNDINLMEFDWADLAGLPAWDEDIATNILHIAFNPQQYINHVNVGNVGNGQNEAIINDIEE